MIQSLFKNIKVPSTLKGARNTADAIVTAGLGQTDRGKAAVERGHLAL